MKISPWIRCLLFVSLMAGCGGSEQLASLEQEITNGVVVAGADYPSTVLLYRRILENGQFKGAATCTGTWISPHQILTAAHCTGEGVSDASGSVEALQMGVIEITDHTLLPKPTKMVAVVKAAYRDKRWEKKKGSNPYDLAILEMAEPKPDEPPRQPVRISGTGAKVGDPISIVGYGFNNMTTFGKGGDDLKRVGANTIDRKANGFLTISGTAGPGKGDGKDSSAGNGDSGGPMFLGDALVGVASSGGTTLFGPVESDYVDLHSTTAQEFLAGFDLSW